MFPECQVVKNSILVKANELIQSGEIDSIKMVRSLEKGTRLRTIRSEVRC